MIYIARCCHNNHATSLTSCPAGVGSLSSLISLFIHTGKHIDWNGSFRLQSQYQWTLWNDSDNERKKSFKLWQTIWHFFLLVATPGGMQGYAFIQTLINQSITPFIVRRSAIGNNLTLIQGGFFNWSARFQYQNEKQFAANQNYFFKKFSM